MGQSLLAEAFKHPHCLAHYFSSLPRSPSILFNFERPRLSSGGRAIPGGERVKLVAVSFQVTRAA